MQDLHQKGLLELSGIPCGSNLSDCLVGLKIAEDGRFWICVDGQSVVRFKPEIITTPPKEK